MVGTLFAPLLIALSLLSVATGAHAQGAGNAFIDFRARPGALWGHTFVLYGRVDAEGRALELHRAGLYPIDGHEGLVIGSVVPVRASVRGIRDDRTETPNAIYRRPLRAREYAQLKAEMQRLRASERAWHMWLHNCNGFAAVVAQSLGLATPPTFLVPNAWVRALKVMNGG